MSEQLQYNLCRKAFEEYQKEKQKFPKPKYSIIFEPCEEKEHNFIEEE